MEPNFGYAFAPTSERAMEGRYGGSPPQTPQGALQVLNFRLPRIAGAASANAISPLVGDERRGATFGGAVLESVLRTVLGADPSTLMGSPAAMQRQGGDPGAAILQSFMGGMPAPSMGGHQPPHSAPRPPVITPGTVDPPVIPPPPQVPIPEAPPLPGGGSKVDVTPRPAPGVPNFSDPPLPNKPLPPSRMGDDAFPWLIGAPNFY